MRIQHNIMAMSAYRNYTNNVSAMKKNLEKLSSGYKINRAGDDAAGLAISEKMRAQITGLETAQKNAKDGISLVQTAEGALTEVHDMLNRMVELASMSANGTYDNTTDRKQLQKEMEQLTDEINRIADSSNFNGIKLLDGSMQQGGQGSTVAGIDRILSETLGAGENPIDQTGLKTILDGGGNSSAQTVFDVDFTGLSGAQAVEGVPSGATPAKITEEKDGHAFTQATKATYSITVADSMTLGGTGTGNTQVTVAIGTTTVANLKTATDATGTSATDTGKLLSDLYEFKVTDAAGNVRADTDKLVAGDIITYTAKTPGALTGANNALTALSSETVTFTNGEDEKPIAAADTPASYEFKLDLTKLDAGQTIALGTKTVTVKNNAKTDDDANIDINGVDFTSKAAGGDLETLANGDLKNALEKTFTDYDVEVTYDSAVGTTQGQATIKLTAKTGKNEAGNQGNVAIKSNSDKNPLVGSVTYTKFEKADTTPTADFATVTYQSDALKAGADGIAAGTKITIGSGDTATTIEVISDADYTAAQAAGTLKDNQIKQTDTKTAATVQAFIEKQANFQSGLVTYNGTDGKLTFKSAESGPDKLAGLKTATQVSVAAPVNDTANQVSFAFKLGGVNVADVSVAKDASSADIAKAVYNKLSANDAGDGKKFTIGNSNYDVKLNGNKLTFTLTDAPDATNIKGNYDWDVIADAGTFKGNHTAGTVVTTPGNVGAAGSLANTVFNMTTGDLVDGTKITIDGKTVTLAVGANSQYKDAEGTVIDLTNLDTSKELTAADLNAALGRISEGFGKDGTTNFIVGVNDKANGDKNIGLTIHKKTSSTQTYATKESLAEVFNITTPGTGKALTLQIGDTAEKFNQLKVDIQDMHADSLGIGKDQISIADQDSAAAAITKIKDAINTVSDVRGTLGATQNRLDHTINNLSVMTENIQDAESTIRDVDVAEEMMAYTKNNILIQSAQAMLAQANQVPQGVLQLLQ